MNYIGTHDLSLEYVGIIIILTFFRIPFVHLFRISILNYEY